MDDVFETSDTGFSFSLLLQDFGSLSSILPGFSTATNPSNPMKLCSLDFNYLFSANRTDFNLTTWAQQQFSVEGDVATNQYINPWTPMLAPSTPGPGTGTATVTGPGSSDVGRSGAVGLVPATVFILVAIVLHLFQ